nr:MAG TPA: hypothetical protein [Caudoviricetes sp.]
MLYYYISWTFFSCSLLYFFFYNFLNSNVRSFYLF